MKKYVVGLGAIVAPSLLGALLSAGCTEDSGLPTGDDICGPCGDIENGDISISGDARLDGFFKALGTMRNTTASIETDFQGNVRALAEIYEVEIDGSIDADAIDDLRAAIRADINAHVQGGLAVAYQPPRCQASVEVALDAQARCEVNAGCDVQATPGEVSVQCEGTCTGSCEGECTGDLACEVQAPNIECTGRCEGACTLEAAATCNGTCRGECSGACSVRDASGDCAGECEGNCTGTCEMAVAAECDGECTGKCLVEPGSAQCTAEASCRGSCSGQCSGGCEGNFTPPSVSAECEAAADCQASAKAEANANLDCTPPQLDVDYTFAASVQDDLPAQAAFTARLAELRTRGVAIIHGSARYQALVTGEVDGRVVFAPSPLAQLRTSVQQLASASLAADFDVPAGRVPCVVPAFNEAGQMLTLMSNSTASTLEAQTEFVSAFTAGFGS